MSLKINSIIENKNKLIDKNYYKTLLHKSDKDIHSILANYSNGFSSITIEKENCTSINFNINSKDSVNEINNIESIKDKLIKIKESKKKLLLKAQIKAITNLNDNKITNKNILGKSTQKIKFANNYSNSESNWLINSNNIINISTKKNSRNLNINNKSIKFNFTNRLDLKVINKSYDSLNNYNRLYNYDSYDDYSIINKEHKNIENLVLYLIDKNNKNNCIYDVNSEYNTDSKNNKIEKIICIHNITDENINIINSLVDFIVNNNLDQLKSLIKNCSNKFLKYIDFNNEYMVIKNTFNYNSAVNNYKETLLHLSIKYVNINIINYLLEQGASPNIQQVNGETPLHYVIKYTNNYKLVRLMLLYNADVCNKRTYDKKLNCIDYAVNYKNDKIIECLESHVLSNNYKNNNFIKSNNNLISFNNTIDIDSNDILLKNNYSNNKDYHDSKLIKNIKLNKINFNKKNNDNSTNNNNLESYNTNNNNLFIENNNKNTNMEKIKDNQDISSARFFNENNNTKASKKDNGDNSIKVNLNNKLKITNKNENKNKNNKYISPKRNISCCKYTNKHISNNKPLLSTELISRSVSPSFNNNVYSNIGLNLINSKKLFNNNLIESKLNISNINNSKISNKSNNVYFTNKNNSLINKNILFNLDNNKIMNMDLYSPILINNNKTKDKLNNNLIASIETPISSNYNYDYLNLIKSSNTSPPKKKQCNYAFFNGDKIHNINNSQKDINIINNNKFNVNLLIKLNNINNSNVNNNNNNSCIDDNTYIVHSNKYCNLEDKLRYQPLFTISKNNMLDNQSNLKKYTNTEKTNILSVNKKKNSFVNKINKSNNSFYIINNKIKEKSNSFFNKSSSSIHDFIDESNGGTYINKNNDYKNGDKFYNSKDINSLYYSPNKAECLNTNNDIFLKNSFNNSGLLYNVSSTFANNMSIKKEKFVLSNTSKDENIIKIQDKNLLANLYNNINNNNSRASINRKASNSLDAESCNLYTKELEEIKVSGYNLLKDDIENKVKSRVQIASDLKDNFTNNVCNRKVNSCCFNSIEFKINEKNKLKDNYICPNDNLFKNARNKNLNFINIDNKDNDSSSYYNLTKEVTPKVYNVNIFKDTKFINNKEQLNNNCLSNQYVGNIINSNTYRNKVTSCTKLYDTYNQNNNELNLESSNYILEDLINKNYNINCSQRTFFNNKDYNSNNFINYNLNYINLYNKQRHLSNTNNNMFNNQYILNQVDNSCILNNISNINNINNDYINIKENYLSNNFNNNLKDNNKLECSNKFNSIDYKNTINKFIDEIFIKNNLSDSIINILLQNNIKSTEPLIQNDNEIKLLILSNFKDLEKELIKYNFYNNKECLICKIRLIDTYIMFQDNSKYNNRNKIKYICFCKLQHLVYPIHECFDLLDECNVDIIFSNLLNIDTGYRNRLNLNILFNKFTLLKDKFNIKINTNASTNTNDYISKDIVNNNNNNDVNYYFKIFNEDSNRYIQSIFKHNILYKYINNNDRHNYLQNLQSILTLDNISNHFCINELREMIIWFNSNSLIELLPVFLENNFYCMKSLYYKMITLYPFTNAYLYNFLSIDDANLRCKFMHEIIISSNIYFDRKIKDLFMIKNCNNKNNNRLIDKKRNINKNINTFLHKTHYNKNTNVKINTLQTNFNSTNLNSEEILNQLIKNNEKRKSISNDKDKKCIVF